MSSQANGDSGPTATPQADAAPPAADWQELAKKLDAELAERVKALGGDPARFEQTWTAIVDAYGPTEAYAIVHRRAGEVLGVPVDLDYAERLAYLARARDNFGTAGSNQPGATLLGLPREGGEYRAAGDFVFPPHVRRHVEGATDGMRRLLREAYENPVLAEARLHALARDLRDPAAIVERVAQEPGLLGTPLAAAPGRDAEPATALRDALAQARIAYEYHFAPTAEVAAEQAAREAFDVLKRAAANVDHALESLDRAIGLHGPDLHEYLQQGRGELLGRNRGRGGPGGGGGGDVRPNGIGASHEPSPHATLDAAPAEPHQDAGGRARVDGSRQPDAPSRPAAPLADAAVEDAFRAAENAEEIRRLEAYAERLREERASGQRVLAVLNLDDTAQLHARRDLTAAAAAVYQNPDAALKRWDELLKMQRGEAARAADLVERRPERLGPLLTEPYTDLRRFLPFLTTTAEARANVPDFMEKARVDATAQQLGKQPVEWTSPDGKRLNDRDLVRATARELVTTRSDEIDRAETAILARGGDVAERHAGRAVSRLSPEQISELTRRLGVSRGISAPEAKAVITRLMATAATRGFEAARVLRAAGEGPGHGL